MINEEIRHIVEAELRDEETLLWVDRPHKFPISYEGTFGFFFAIMMVLAMIIVFIPHGLSFLLASSAQSEPLEQEYPGITFIIFSILFLIYGLILLYGGIRNFFGTATEVYAITNQRGIVINNFVGRVVSSLSPYMLQNCERHDKGKLGTLKFNYANGKEKSDPTREIFWVQFQTFHNIVDAKSVENLISQTFPVDQACSYSMNTHNQKINSTMKTFRRISMFLAVLLMICEVWRSWGDGRHIMFILDDIFAGVFMLYAAVKFTSDTPAKRATFAAAWGVAVGMLYGSFFGKLLADGPINSGNWDADILTSAIGVAFALSILGLILAVRMPFESRP